MCLKKRCFCSVHYVKNEVNEKPQKEKKILKLCSLSGKHLKYKKAEPDNEVCEASIRQIFILFTDILSTIKVKPRMSTMQRKIKYSSVRVYLNNSM